MKDRLLRKFEEEIATLTHELKLELPKEIKRARELGDLRENAEYHAAKERQRLIEARISMLQKRVGRAFLNKEAGDAVKVATPGGVREFEIVKLITIHDEGAG